MSRDNQSQSLAAIRALLVDMDGVLYRGQAPVPGAADFLNDLRRRGVPYVLLTNNSTRTPAQYVAKLADMGIEAGEEVILTSAQATAVYLAERAPAGARCCVIGADGLWRALEERGLQPVASRDAEYVVVGMDLGLTYEKLKVAALAIRDGARFIATNPDKTFPAEEGITPGCGAILAALEAATEVSPTVVGKPRQAMFDLALDRLGAVPAETAMIGDRLETDVLGGQRVGLTTVLVLTGITDRGHLQGSATQPDLVFADVAAFHCRWLAARED